MTLRVLVLAGGASRRLGEPKALARIGLRTALEHVLDAAQGASSEPALVVGGRHATEIQAALAGRGDASFVACPDWELGRTASLQAGLAALPPDCDIVVAPVDVPLVGGATFAALAREWSRLGAPPRGWLAPSITVDGARAYGHPIVLGEELAALALGLGSDVPLHRLRAAASPLASMDVDDAAILDDLDTPEDLARLRTRHAGP